MYIFAEVRLYSGQRKTLPKDGYRPDAIFDGETEYWAITFAKLPITAFDTLTPAIMGFSVQPKHYQQIRPGQTFRVMEGAKQVGEGKILSIEKDAYDARGQIADM